MPLTIDPGDEAAACIVDRINSSLAYTLPTPAIYSVEAVDVLETVNALRVDVTVETDQQLHEMLDQTDRTSHILRVWVRDKLENGSAAAVMSRKLLTRKIFQRVDEFVSADRRLQVWDCGKDKEESPGKQWIIKNGMYVSFFELRVTVAPPA